MENRPWLLVVDADDGSRTSLATLFREYGYPVAEARNGAEGILRARERAPALVVLDPWPFVSAAAQMVGRLRSLLPDTKVVVLTSVAHAGLSVRSWVSGTMRFLEKPCPPAELLAEVERLLGAGEPAVPEVDA